MPTDPAPAFDPDGDPAELAAELIADDGRPWLTAPDGDDPVPPDDRLADEPAEVQVEEE